MAMSLTRRELPVLVVSAAYLCVFGIVAIRRRHHEFLLYVAVIVVLAGWILGVQRKVRFGPRILWGLSLWGLLHMCGGLVRVGDGVLYGVQLVPRVLRYDQFVHAFGFGVATLACYHLLRPFLRPDIRRGLMLPMLVVLMGCGLGAINEILEFIAVKTMPQTGVGGYDNTLWDLVFNLIGATTAVAWKGRSSR